jgi:hypothetical protein
MPGTMKTFKPCAKCPAAGKCKAAGRCLKLYAKKGGYGPTKKKK